jgi:hypothetical protein
VPKGSIESKMNPEQFLILVTHLILTLIFDFFQEIEFWPEFQKKKLGYLGMWLMEFRLQT